MQIKNTYPPNWEQIKLFNPPKNAVFPYGDIIYNPSKEEIPPDIQFHEQIHQEQQRKFPSPDLWWQKWRMDKDFRKEQEVHAFGEQLKFVKKFYPAKASKEALDEMANNLSNNYKLNISKHQAESLIRHYDKKT